MLFDRWVKHWRGFKQWRKWQAHKDDELILTAMAVGMNSTVDVTKDLHIVVLDYDIQDLKMVVESVKELQEFWNLADAYIFKTKNGHHAFFWFDHVPYGRLKQIIDYARYVDPMFKYIGRYYDHKTIRANGKHKLGDIKFERVVSGQRRPTLSEMDIGEMKMKEHKLMIEFGVEAKQ